MVGGGGGVLPINGLIKFLHVVFLFTLRQLVNFISFFMGQGYSTLPLRVSEYNTWIAHMKVISCSMPKGWPIVYYNTAESLLDMRVVSHIAC